ncbi:MAG: flagellar brake protein [Clostridia bacterium]
MLDLKKYFAVGEKILMEYIDASGHLHGYSSQVFELHQNEFLDVLIPIHKNQDIYLKQDTILKLVVSRGEAVYELRAVLNDKLFGRVPLYRLKVFAEINKIQRRDFYRLKLMRDVEAAQVEDLKARKYSERFRCNLHDISAGGLHISSAKELHEKDMLEITLNLNDRKLVVFGIIIRRTPSGNTKAPYAYGVRFDRMSDFERNEISKFIFEEQRRLIKKGLV